MGNYNEVYMSDGPLYTENEIKDIVHIIESINSKLKNQKIKKHLLVVTKNQ